MKHPQTWLQYVKYRYMNALYKANKPTWFREFPALIIIPIPRDIFPDI